MRTVSLRASGVGLQARARERGFSLLEVLFATAIVVTGVAALAPLFALSARANVRARTSSIAAVLAAQKMEQLRSLAWGYDASWLPRSDTTTDTTAVPERPSGGTGLSPSPPGSLAHNASGYCDFLDAGGRPLGGGTTPPAGAVYVRRWSIDPLPANPGNTLIVQVRVMPIRSREPAAGTRDRAPDEARLVAVRTRKAT